MIRTVISLREDEREWVIKKAKTMKISMAEFIRRLIQKNRVTEDTEVNIHMILKEHLKRQSQDT